MAKNVLGTDLTSCSNAPVTGYFRNGKCETCSEDYGMHTICVEMTEEFLSFSKQVGNDLSTPRTEYDFPGLNAGDKWCVCLGRWIEAYNAGVIAKVDLEATHISVLEHVEMEILRQYAI